MNLAQVVGKSVRPYLPQNALPFVIPFYRAYMRLLCWYVGLGDQRRISQSGFSRLPPAALRYRVHGSPYLDGFLRVGQQCGQDIEAALGKIGKNLEAFPTILDFGCGCGRTLIWFANRHGPFFYGTDIDAKAIAWCQRNLDFAQFQVNQPLPPLNYSDDTFDLIYAISVFTHLDEDFQFRWLAELRRVARPGGIVLLTVHVPGSGSGLPAADLARLNQKGFLFIRLNAMQGIFPVWYQDAYHTQAYVLSQYRAYFKILEHMPQGLNQHQDIVLLQKE